MEWQAINIWKGSEVTSLINKSIIVSVQHNTGALSVRQRHYDLLPPAIYTHAEVRLPQRKTSMTAIIFRVQL